MSTGQTLRVCGAALSDHCALQLLSAGTHRLEPPSAAVEDVTATGSCAYQQGKSRPNLPEGAGGGVVYQTHRHTVISKLKGQLQYEVSSNS